MSNSNCPPTADVEITCSGDSYSVTKGSTITKSKGAVIQICAPANSTITWDPPPPGLGIGDPVNNMSKTVPSSGLVTFTVSQEATENRPYTYYPSGGDCGVSTGPPEKPSMIVD
jgi:hypothetical protein